MEKPGGRHTRAGQLLRGALFLIVLVIAVFSIQSIFSVDANHSYENIGKYRGEKNGTLDAVFIGASTVHRFWQPLFGWSQHGIAVWNYSVDLMPASAIRYMLTEARKTQPDALYLINLSAFRKEEDPINISNLHKITDYMPLSLNKIQLVQRLSAELDMSLLDQLEFYLPIIRFHTRWDSLETWEFGEADFDYKASSHWSVFNKETKNISQSFQVFDTVLPAPESMTAILDELMDYCDSEHVRVLFVKVPQAVEEEDQARLNDIENRVKERGYECLDMMEKTEEMMLDLTQDFYNENHLNLHGSLKFSDWLGNYLTEHYHLEDKRGKAGWESWDNAAKDYLENYLSPYYLPFETSLSNRTDGERAMLDPPYMEGKDAVVCWWGTDWADGYEIYRKEKDKAWKLIASVEKGRESYTDSKVKSNRQYTYTVVPYKTEDGRKLYGPFDVQGKTVKTGGD